MPVELQGKDFPLLGDDDLAQDAKDAKPFVEAEEISDFADIRPEAFPPPQNMR
jgi:hypothetical protein